LKQIRTLPFPAVSDMNTTVGLVPTMGYLHEGHASLLKRARQECDIVVLSIFVNPLQFGPHEDFAKYPRDTERDMELAESHGVDIVFIPDVEVMYPKQIKTTVSVHGVTERLCGASRPGHFDGVATVVSKLFHIIKPHKAYFGMKDAQQVAVIQQMVEDLNMDIEIVPCATLRDSDGLALSSRNVYLSPQERQDALVLNQALSIGTQWLEDHKTFSEARRGMIDHIETAASARIDYVELLTYPGLEPLPPQGRSTQLPAKTKIVLALAVKIGKTRLIDNRILEI
jgi:pantoate--beta-alanine ligase